MIDFVCPGCVSTHSANEAFAGLRARCVVCGAGIVIPETNGVTASSWEPATSSRGRSGTVSRPARRPAVHAARAKRPVILETEEDLDETSARESVVDDSVPDSEMPDERPDATDSGSIENKEDLLTFNKLDDEKLFGKEAEKRSKSENRKSKGKKRYSAAAIADAATDDADAKEIRNRRIKTGIAIGVTVLCVSMAVYVAFFRGESTPKLQPAPTPAPTKPTVQPKKEEPVAPPPPPGIAPPPRPYRPTNRFTAAGFFLERNADPLAFDKLYSETYLVIQGAHARTVNGVITLTDNPDDLEGIVCVPPKLTGKESSYSVSAANSAQVQPGLAVAVRGIYTSALRLTDFELLKTGSPGDDEYRDKDIEIAGIVSQVRPEPDGERLPSVTLEPTTTDCPVAIRCLFDTSAWETLARLRPGQPVVIRGHCEGRLSRSVLFHNCTLVDSSASANPAFLHVSSDRLFAAYETDLLPAPRLGPNADTIPIAADQLVSAFTTNLKQANSTYRYRMVQIGGRVLERRPASRSILLETRTNDRFKIVANFNAARFSVLLNDKDVLIRGVCMGVRDANFIHIENAELLNLEPRLVADYLPFEPGRETLYDSLAPLKLKDNIITQLKVRVGEADLITTTAIRSGNFPGGTLFGNPTLQPRWLRDLTKLKITPAPIVTQHRLRDDTIEIRQIPAAPLQPSPWWDPVLKLGSKRGDSWSSEMPDGRTITYTVMDFKKDENQRLVVDIRRVAKHPKDQSLWEESLITYARGHGEVRRSVAKQSTGLGVAVLEMRYVESGLEGIVELKAGTKNEVERKETDKKDVKEK